MMKSVFSRISHPDSTATAAISRTPIGARFASSQASPENPQPVMTCEKEYQSERCCESSGLPTTPVEAKILIESNGGTIPVILKAEKPVKPFPTGPLKGAKAPREVAKMAMEAAKEVAQSVAGSANVASNLTSDRQ
jgi:hypothetical protein